MRSGIDRQGMDEAIRPQDDLFGHVNGGWVATTEVPADRGRFGVFDLLRDQAQEHVRDLLEEASHAAGTTPAQGSAGTTPAEGPAGTTHAEGAAEPVRPADRVGPDPREDTETARAKVGALYASFMDTERIEALGLKPVAAELAEVDALTDVAGLWRLLGTLGRTGVSGAVAAYVDTDKRASDRYVCYLYQAGIGLPDEAYYREEQYTPVREAYLVHVETMLALAGRDAPAQEAAQVMQLETRLAAGHWDRVATRDAVKTYTKVTAAELADLAPGIDWADWARATGAPEGALDPCVVAQPSFLTALSDAVRTAPLAQWQAWLRWQILRSRAPHLPEVFVAENFAFYGRTLTGATRVRDRWRRGIALVDMMLGEAAGRLYVERHFSAGAKERMITLVANLVEAYRQDIADLVWMSPPTRQKALDKLAAFTPKIGYPDRWRDYSAYALDPTDLVGNVRRGYAFEADRDWAKLGRPVDHDEWFMSPQTVNAYYNPGMNEIVFPAAILQPPFFDAGADDAVNYGAIGSVIGHEIGHGFDDQGSRFDGAGNLVDWWTPEDRERFDALAQALVAQYDRLSPRELPGETVNGALTVGENIGDLGGVTIAHLAYRIALGGAPGEEVDGMSGHERFFFGWAQAWRGRSRPEEARRLLSVDPHSPVDLRANIVRNLSEFHAAFGVAPGDGLWLPEEERVRIW